MNSNYEVMLGDASVGKIQVSHRGLYYHFSARCEMPDTGVYRIVACWKDGWHNIGIPLPEGDCLVLKKSIAAAHFVKDEMKYLMMPVDADPEQYMKSCHRSNGSGEKIKEVEYEEDHYTQSDSTERENMEQEKTEDNKTHDKPDETSGETAMPEMEAADAAWESHREEDPVEYVPLDPDAPFPVMERLTEGCFTIWEGGPAVKLCGEDRQTVMESPTGQWSEPVISE